jgi:uncharacterized protein YecE (DUF72 family)
VTPEAPARPIANIYYGTCSWTDRSLVESGAFYPPGVSSPAARLRHYAHEFPLVEVDATYYAPPSERNARLWAERAPPGFLFNIKAYGLLTHHPVEVRTLPAAVREHLEPTARDKRRVYLSALAPQGRELLWRMHLDALEPLVRSGKLGAVLFQFPHWFRPTPANRDYLQEVRERLPWPVAIEFRGGGWLGNDESSRKTLSLLERLGLCYVVVDEPQGFRSSTPPVVACTAPLAMIRFHGHNAETWEQRGIGASERFRYLYSQGELRQWVPKARALAGEAEQVHLLMNNCYRDYAVRNVRELAALLQRQDPAPGDG